ncbi:MAG: UDP-N-acetylglucosamine 1-carboxyvinyltransferase, partial [Actinomycetota bacterium]|nr:UDP-N-acetylglucosamine 1-carboxyvinyltransferase [Actinomycetota bacterium]
MKTYVVNGPSPLTGEVAISGAKNSALKIMAASLMIPGEVQLRRVPNITDVWLMAEVLERLGAKVAFQGDSLTIDASGELADETPYELVRKMRASIQVLGPLLARRGEVRVALPGGDAIGSRPVDLHLQGLEKMGAKFTVEHGYIEGRAERLRGSRILLEFPSVGATENLLMSAVTAEGTTVVDNAAREPEIQDLATFLNASGAKISGAGTPTVTVEGVEELTPAAHEIIPDRIEAGTFAIGAAATRGDVRLTNLRSDHLDLVLQKLTDAGAEVQRGSDEVRIAMSRRPEALNLV